MSMNEADAMKKAEGFKEFHEQMWCPSQKWDKEWMLQMFSKDLQLGWPGKWTNGFDAVYDEWIPMKNGGLMKQRKTLDMELHTWGQSMVKWTDYAMLTTFDNKELFIPIQIKANWNEEGKICQMSWVMTKKYEKKWNDLVSSFMATQ